MNFPKDLLTVLVIPIAIFVVVILLGCLLAFALF